MRMTRKKITGTMMLAMVLALGLLAPASATSDNAVTCQHTYGYDDNLTQTSSGDWGTATWTADGSDGRVSLTVSDGYEVTICIKKASGDDSLRQSTLGVGTHEIDWDGNAFSHYGIKFVELDNGGNDVVDFCDPAQRPAGMSIDEWLTQAEVASEGAFDRSDCFEIEPVLECGSFDAAVTGPYEGYEMVYLDGADQTTSLTWKELPAVFGEDAGGGSVDITVYLVGPEKDYLTDSGLPNYWDDNGRTVTIDTDCGTPRDITITTTPTPTPVPAMFEITFLKDWAGDVNGGNPGTTIVTGEVTVEFTVAVNGEELDDMFAPGDVLEVDEGDDVAITAETLSDLGGGSCSSATALPGALTDVSSDGTLTVINTVDCADVLAEVIEEPEETEEPVKTPVETKVLAEVQERQTLPRSGASAVLLTLMGLLGIGLGGGMIGSRKRS